MSSDRSSRARALARIREVVGPAGIVDDPTDLPAYLNDERGIYRGEAALVVRPSCTEEVAAVVTLCREAGLGVVPQGGNTGYCGGATPDDGEGQILLNLSRMNRIRALDPVGATMTVDAGLVLAHAREAAADAGLLFPLSMGSEGSCQIGGNLATNAGGLTVLRYGSARDLVLGLEVVLPDGRILHGLSGLRKDNTGYDLRGLFCGSEGTLGVITGAVLKLSPRPAATVTAWLAVADPDAACRLLSRARRESADAVSSFEYITRPSLELVLDHIEGATDPLEEVAAQYILLEIDGGPTFEAVRTTTESILMGGLDDGEILDGAVAETEAQRRALWRLRESIPEAEKHAGGSIKHDVALTIDRIPTYLDEALRVVQEVTACRTSVYGHIGDGNLHFNLLAPPGADARAFREAEGRSLSQAVHRLAAEMGGSFSAEHGIGKLKRPELEEYRDPVALDAMRAIKKALDPSGIMNPGKIVDGTALPG